MPMVILMVPVVHRRQISQIIDPDGAGGDRAGNDPGGSCRW
jgi:hypothetical protein